MAQVYSNPSEQQWDVGNIQQTDPTTPVQCDTDPSPVNRVVVYGDLTYTTSTVRPTPPDELSHPVRPSETDPAV
ncbi:E3 ubiquitin-protein ligase CHFR-like [Scomber scombrus]|uniref:E3 ubiquitin-protein ligase CHFR-like n=1 Tax=Scomber scombrus TaxID=13677 RepID=A0AAV1PL22_SCOSC